MLKNDPYTHDRCMLVPIDKNWVIRLIMVMLQKGWIHLTIGLVACSNIFTQPAWSDAPVDNPMLSESFCLELFDRIVKQYRSGDWNMSDRDRSSYNQCMIKFSPSPSSDAALPKAAQCISILKKIWDGGITNLKEADIPDEQSQSLARCSEVIQAYYMPATSMLPTLKVNERLIVDKTAYQSASPQRGDIIVMQPTKRLKQENFKDKLIKRIIGLPGETIKINQGKVYINGRPINEDYITEPPAYEQASTLVPKNNYFVLGDNRNNSYDSHYWGFLPRNLIIGKIVWQSNPK
jgi:signal peptidase I